MTPTESPSPTRRPARTVLVVLAVLLVLAAGVWVVRSLGDDGSAASPSASASASASADASVDPSAAPSAPEVSAAPTEPGAGDAEEPAPTEVFGPTATAAVDAPITVTPGVAVTVTSPEAIAGDGVGPGEIDGPSIRFTVRVENSTDAPISLVSAVVNAYFGASLTPGIQLSGSGAQALPDAVPAASEVEGVFVFLIPADRTPTRIEVYSVPQADVVVAESATPAS